MSSRLCVKGLPKYVTEARLREHFSAKGEVTDAKVVKSRDGTSRQFGFIGFRSAGEAAAALKYFNRTFMDTSRITVEIAEKFGSQQISRPWSKYSEGSSAHKKLVATTAPVTNSGKVDSQKKGKPGSKEEDDPQLAEFLQLMQPRRAGTIWSNDDIALAQPTRPNSAGLPLPSNQATQAKSQHKAAKLASAVDNSSDEEEEYQELPSSRDSDASASDSGDEDQPVQDAAVLDEGVSDLDYLKSRMKSRIVHQDADERSSSQTSSLTDTHQAEEEQDAGSAEPGATELETAEMDAADREAEEARQQERRASHAQAGSKDAEATAEEEGDGEGQGASGRLFLRNLPFTTTEAELSDAFADFGDLQEVHLVLDRATKKSRGIGYVQYVNAQDAGSAMSALDGSIFQGRLLHILPARKAPAPAEPLERENVSSGTKFKEGRELERKAQAGNRAAWNSLFMRPDTVAEAIAAHYGISKAQLLSREAADLPVRMALGEAHVVALTKKALGDAGVAVDALEAAAAASGKASNTHSVARSPVCLLVKNLPFSATVEDLTELFGGSGTIARLVLPSTKTLALVEFTEPQDARRAFKALAYKRYQHVPIYLEWAPANIFTADAPKQQPAAQTAKATDAAATAAGGDAPAVEAAAAAALPDTEEADTSTIYIKNLAFATGDAGLRKHFENAVSSAGGSMRSVKVAMRKGPDGKPLSMGFGFVECSSEDAAKAVLKQLQGSILDKHKLALQLSMRKAGKAVKSRGQKDKPDKQSTKLVVRNVAFEATRQEVMSLFSPFGHMKSCRLPRKFDGTPRGFAFIEFVTKQEAKNAMDSLGGAHLYGRRLVVEWAEQGDEGLDEIRAKTAAKFRGEAVEDFDGAPVPKRRKAT